MLGLHLLPTIKIAHQHTGLLFQRLELSLRGCHNLRKGLPKLRILLGRDLPLILGLLQLLLQSHLLLALALDPRLLLNHLPRQLQYSLSVFLILSIRYF